MPIELKQDLSNLRLYVDELFTQQVRTPPDILDLDPDGDPVLKWFNNTQSSVELLTGTLFNLFKQGVDEVTQWNVPSDRLLMNFMSKQLSRLSMFVPALELTGSYEHWEGKPMFKKKYVSPVYRIAGYRKFSLDTDGGLYSFLSLFLAGAHIVVLHNEKDLGIGNVSDFYDEFATSSTLERFRMSFTNPWFGNPEPEGEVVTDKTTAFGHSHYTGSVALKTAYGYPIITEDKAPVRCPIVSSLLVDTTDRKSNKDYNTFFQLEGWPGVSMGGAAGRHAADFELHQATKWNISTYGLCPYSEKRGTTIFLAPDNWKARVSPGWTMPSYAGARLQTPPWVTTDSLTKNLGGVLE